MRPQPRLAFLILFVAALSSPRPAGAAEAAALRPFTVQDAIEISHFASHAAPDEDSFHLGPIVSPDGRSFLVITERGVLAGDRIESTIWLFDQAFDRSPILAARHKGDPRFSVLWDPNPQLAGLALGTVSLYHWRDRDGTPWSGLLALPPGYDPRRRYPLVVQTHGIRVDQFFADGTFTTGSGGRALTAKGMIVLQMDMPLAHIFTVADAPFQLAGFEGAIDQLAKERRIDRHHVGVIGFSFTCFHTLYALTHHPDLFAAAAITDGNNMSYSQSSLSLAAVRGRLVRLLAQRPGGPRSGEGRAVRPLARAAQAPAGRARGSVTAPSYSQVFPACQVPPSWSHSLLRITAQCTLEPVTNVQAPESVAPVRQLFRSPPRISMTSASDLAAAGAASVAGAAGAAPAAVPSSVSMMSSKAATTTIS
jgi:hypothetical protein